ncbi:F0F1 ATP synthase subunit B [Campylobacter sp. MIT 99-7217]|uniref:F0F1 ATP synthase subunit B n=1 Tax=Campylobacter sp. MIT 99-7217 TaxID=535091 RepID=UPI001158FB95|nr:F0F1 ATP synthase subunit B [Campylobacter sp. MIT 99-7217]TQR30327.1 F0F1 ATP synthase subunit B [Campylobacter sp. MIT 99-7217]
MKKILASILLSPLVLFAASGGTDYDIVPRAVNFVIFVAILYYFLANPAKTFYKNRIKGIATRLDDIQRRVLDSKNKKLEIMKRLEDAKKESANAISSARKEAELIAEKILAENKNNIAILEKQFEEQKMYELRKMQKEVVSRILTQIFKDKGSILKQDDIVNIMLKKVS